MRGVVEDWESPARPTVRVKTLRFGLGGHGTSRTAGRPDTCFTNEKPYQLIRFFVSGRLCAASSVGRRKWPCHALRSD